MSTAPCDVICSDVGQALAGLAGLGFQFIIAVARVIVEELGGMW